jgi:hypothetical protein
MTKDQAIKHLKLMQSGARNAIRFKKNDKKISEEERKEDIEIYQDQLEALEIATKILEQPISDDCVSRTQALKELKESAEHHANDSREEVLLRRDRDIIRALPPVAPIRKVGKWDILACDLYMCSKCYAKFTHKFNYCPTCGVEMRGSEE